jgi:hypothetical protein
MANPDCGGDVVGLARVATMLSVADIEEMLLMGEKQNVEVKGGKPFKRQTDPALCCCRLPGVDRPKP